jgi:hypothetical protein
MAPDRRTTTWCVTYIAAVEISTVIAFAVSFLDFRP